MQDVSATGFSVIVRASKTYPSGIVLTSFADDADPLDFPEMTIAEFGMTVNGDLVTWSSPKPIEVTLPLLPGAKEGRDMDYLFEANRVAKNKRSAGDVITLTVNYPNGRRKVLRNGKMTKGIPGIGVAQDGRLKTKTYGFVFENAI